MDGVRCVASFAVTTAKATSPPSDLALSPSPSYNGTGVRTGQDATWRRIQCWFTNVLPSSVSVRLRTLTNDQRLTDCVDSGAQPLVNEDETVILAVNGEIYNHVALRQGLKHPAKFKTHSDCEVIMHLVASG